LISISSQVQSIGQLGFLVVLTLISRLICVYRSKTEGLTNWGCLF